MITGAPQILHEPEDVTFRKEFKHEINKGDCLLIRSRMSHLAKTDKHAGADGRYRIRSLYFDNLYDKALREKMDGLRSKEKFRIRLYDNDLSFIKLEKKTKIGSVGYKVSARLTEEQCRRLLRGDTDWMPATGDALVLELYAKMKYQLLKPKTVVDYDREPFVYGPGNVRVTLDSDIRTGLRAVDFLNPDLPMMATNIQPKIILEVKYDEYLPSVIKNAVRLPGRRTSGFSKYAACRIFD